MPSSRRAAIEKARSFGHSLCSNGSPPPGPAGRVALVHRPQRARPPAGAPGRPFQVELNGRKVAGEVWGERPAGGAPDRADAGRLPGPRLGRVALAAGRFVAPLVAAGFRVVAFDAPSHGDPTPVPKGPAAAPSSSSPTPWPRRWPPTARPTR